MGIYGQDWASYQSSTPDTSGISFAFIKVTEGLGYVNPRWAAQRDHAKGAGLVTGFYHYPHMHDSAQQEADYFLSKVTLQPGDLAALDWEGYDAANQSVSAAAQLAYKEAFLAYLKGRLPHNPVGLYANTDYWNRVDTTGHRGDFLWIATAGRAAGDPGIRADWLFHQYTDSPVDSDFCHLGSTAELRSWAHSFAQGNPTPVEVDMPLTDDEINRVAAAVWNFQLNALKADGSPQGNTLAAFWFPTWRDVVDVRNAAAFARIETAQAAESAAVSALAALLGAQHTGVDTAAVVTAVQAAIAAAVVHVDVQVGSKPAA